MLPKQAVVDELSRWIESVKDGCGVARQGCCEHDNLIQRRDSLQKFITIRTFAGEHWLVHYLVGCVRDIDSDDDIGMFDLLEL